MTVCGILETWHHQESERCDWDSLKETAFVSMLFCTVFFIYFVKQEFYFLVKWNRYCLLLL